MPTRKQRRRRNKERRHEYEYVYVDEEGREVEVDEAELKPAKKTDAKGRPQSGRAGARPRRKIEPPSWRRVGKRGLIFAPLMFLMLGFLGRNLTVAQRVTQTIILLGFFLPFSYLMDALMYRSYRKRVGDAGGTDDARRR